MLMFTTLNEGGRSVRSTFRRLVKGATNEIMNELVLYDRLMDSFRQCFCLCLLREKSNYWNRAEAGHVLFMNIPTGSFE